jgi:hypothetical protein
VAKRQNHNAIVGSWGHELLNLCCDAELLILNGRTPSDELKEFICLVIGGCNTVNYIIGSPIVWQAVTHFEVIIDDTRYYMVGGDSNHRPLRLWLNINCNFVEPQHTVEEYQLALTTCLGNMWVVDSIGHLGVDGLADLL